MNAGVHVDSDFVAVGIRVLLPGESFDMPVAVLVGVIDNPGFPRFA
jgi:hypothetical protein